MPANSDGTPIPADELGAPARRALSGAGYTTLEQLAEHDETEVAELHGIGPSAMDALVEHDLVDEYRLMVHPVIQGGGKRLFEGSNEPSTMNLVDTEAFSSGVVVLTYEPSEEDHLGKEV